MSKRDGVTKGVSEPDMSFIEHCILDKDGSCRDINMDDMDIQAAGQILSLLLQSYDLKRCINQVGDELTGRSAHSLLHAEFLTSPNALHIVLEGDKNLISNLQLFFHWNEPAAVWLELTFFPQDVRKPFTLERFKEFMEPILDIANPAIYYVRYENASWTYGDTSFPSGMIYCEQREHRQSVDKETTMPEEPWKAVDEYLAGLFVPEDPALTDALAESEAAGLDPISVSPMQGKLLNLLVQLTGARRILEIGTLGGYSTIWMSSALPTDGKLISLELMAHHAEVARKNIERAGLGERVEIRLGAALDTLKAMVAAGESPFDLIFVDADKENIPGYFEWSMKLARKGTLIIVDNVIRAGAVVDGDSEDVSVQGVRRFNEIVAIDPRVTTSTVQTVGSKGYDGFAMVLVTGD